MATLSRIVRIVIDPAAVGGTNSFAGTPAMRGLGRYYELEVTCRGVVHPVKGYLIDIKDVDRAVREHAVPIIARACRETPAIGAATLMPALWHALLTNLSAPLETLRWRLTPYYSIEMNADQPQRVLLRQQFDFSASHRLHAAALSDGDNRAAFGKCNNPSGHGHNYRVEPAVALRTDAADSFSLADLERITDETVIKRLDHKHLNIDVPEFATGAGGLNPSVENIARVCFGLLGPAVAQASSGAAELRSITVWETDRTSSTFPA